MEGPKSQGMGGDESAKTADIERLGGTVVGQPLGGEFPDSSSPGSAKTI